MTITERERAKAIADKAIAYIESHPKCQQATTFAELHNYCDANVIGGQDDYLDECAAIIATEHPDWTEDEIDEEALDVVAPVNEHAEKILNLWLEWKHETKEETK